MVSLRLQRIGKKKQPYFRLLAQDKRKNPHGKALEILGSFDPRTKELHLQEDRIKYWLSVGAQPTNRIHNLLVDRGIITEAKVKTVKLTKRRLEKINKKKEAEVAKQKAKEEKVKAEEVKTEEVKEEVKAE